MASSSAPQTAPSKRRRVTPAGAARSAATPKAARSRRTKAAPASRATSAPRSASASASASAKARRDPLLSAICHDLRAPLAAVTMGANFVLQTTQRDDAHARSVKILEAMLRSCTQMERLIRNFADLSEIEGDAVALRLGMHDAGEMLELAAVGSAEAARARSVTVEVLKPSTPITMRADRERLLRALGHVTENAVKLAPEGSTVTLSVAMKDASVAFAVTDRGPGLSAQLRRNLFDRHWHAKRASRVGAGFGLAIARGFVLAHGGRLSVESRPGELTTFTLSVPKEGSRDDAEPARAPRPTSNGRARA